jgi:prolipoprotein diacylglyceryl transferase
MFFASIPSPTLNLIAIGPLKIHFYALAILLGIIVAIKVTDRRLVALGERAGLVSDIAIVVVPAGIIGGRLYHVLTTPELYFGKGGHLLDALKIWNGGLGIWGAISIGALAAWRSYRRARPQLNFRYFADAIAPGLFLAQAIGRWGNWFNVELFGKPTTLPWGLEVPRNFRPAEFLNYSTFQPTFLYESLWCLLGAWIALKVRGEAGRVFWFYVGFYGIGRLWIEALRVDHSHLLFSMRLNVWTSLLVIVLGGLGWWRTRLRR